ncbi:MAG: hypothetical protein E6J90_45895 [Deltaproteobacteria bacterium]|nr:MAG: hypothetical protein E6J90_45895 [Deltaproteobacteria bacterium]
MPATFSDLSVGAALDGRATVGTSAVMMIAAGPSLYMITQATSDPSGTLTGPARVVPVATADHTVGTALPGTMTGAVTDGAGADDGATLVIGTAAQLFQVDASTGTATALADGSFGRVAILSITDDHNARKLVAIAIKNRASSTTSPCPTTAELWWAPLGGGAAHMIATGGFSDIATDRGAGYYVDACKGELGKITETAAMPIRQIPGTGPGPSGGPGKPTALAVSNGQAYVGVEALAAGTTPATTWLLVMPADAPSGAVRTLWAESAQQVLDVRSVPEVRRQLNASSAVFNHLEIGAGGDYVALTTKAHFHGNEIVSAGFPDTTIDTEELRVFAAATGGAVQRYRSWCDGVIKRDPLQSQFLDWECAVATGQTAPADNLFEHHIGSMTFLFGKR